MNGFSTSPVSVPEDSRGAISEKTTDWFPGESSANPAESCRIPDAEADKRIKKGDQNEREHRHGSPGISSSHRFVLPVHRTGKKPSGSTIGRPPKKLFSLVFLKEELEYAPE